MLYTTLNAIRDEYPCGSQWKKLLTHMGKTGGDDEPLPIATILDSNGIWGTLWVLNNVLNEDGRKICITFAADCAEHVLPIFESAYQKDIRPREAIASVRKVVTATDLDDASDAAEIAWVKGQLLGRMFVRSDPASSFSLESVIYAIHAAYLAGGQSDLYAGRASSAAVKAAFFSVDVADRRQARTAEHDWQITRLRELLEAAS